MLVTAMTEKEMEKEVYKDASHFVLNDDFNDRKFRRKVIKAKQFPVYYNYARTTKNSNRWLIFLECREKKELKQGGRITTVCVVSTAKGRFAIMNTITNGKTHLVFFTPHFFSRYAERTESQLTGEQLLIHYFTYNYNFVYDTYQAEIYGSTKDGICLGFISENNNFMFKTFITYQMCKGEQISKFAENEKIRQEIHETD